MAQVQDATQDSTASSSSKRKHKHRHHYDPKNMRTIGRWYIGETLGKGGYSWVKKGYDKKTGKCVALKFMTKADESWVAEQSKQVVTEIESLKQIRHENVMKLYAYNLNARYPSKDEKTGKDTSLDTILLVLEYAPGGELFDILYYTSALEEIVARTYFRQIIAGLEACHNAGVAHRDLKPQNLLLDSRFNVKITDFGLSKLFESDADAQMKTTYVGTRGYQAPELLLEKTYDLSCDIFSIGVVLFILMTGYPPFEQATATDRWYKPMVKKPANYDKFWECHMKSPLGKYEECRDLIQKMLAFDPKERISITDIKKHPWYNGKYLEGKDLIRALRNRHKEMELKRKKDTKKQADLQTSIKNRDIDFGGIELPPLIPSNFDEDITFLHTTEYWRDIYEVLKEQIGKIGGVANYNKELQLLECKLAIKNQENTFDFIVQIYLSQKYNTDIVFDELERIRIESLQKKENTFGKDDNNNDNNENNNETNNESNNDSNNNNDTLSIDAQRKVQIEEERRERSKKLKAVYAVRIKRLSGDETQFVAKILNKFFATTCSQLFTGIPNDRLNKNKNNKNKNTKEIDDTKEENNELIDDIEFDDESDDNYDNMLKEEGLQFDSSNVPLIANVADDAKADE